MESESINQNYTLEAEILTPVHVGAGAEKDWLENADFVFDNKKVYLLDHKKIIDAIGPDKFAHALTAPNRSSLKNMLPGPVKNYASKVLECDAGSNNEIKAHVRAGLENKPVIPGSSLKGALRSVIIHHLNPSNKIEKNSPLNKQIMGSSTEGDEFGRFFKVTDVSFDETKLINSKIFNLTQKGNNFESGWKHSPKDGTKPGFNPNGFNTVYEYIPMGEKGVLQFSMASKPFENLKKKNLYYKQNKLQGKEKLMTGQVEYLFKVINDHTRSYLEKEIDFFEKYNQAEYTEKILESLTALKNKIPEDNSYCIMRLAAGSGFHSITGDWKLESHNIDKLTNTIQTRKGPKTISRGMLNGQESAKSRKVAIKNGQFLPMGFIKLQQITAEDIKARKEQERQKAEEARKQEELEAKRRKEDRIREEIIQKLLGEANDLLAKEQFTEAMEKLDEVAEMHPGDIRLPEKREAIENARKAYEDQLREEENRKAFEKKQREQTKYEALAQKKNKEKQLKKDQEILEKGLSKLISDKDFDQAKSYIAHYFGLQNQQIPEAEYELLKKFLAKEIQKLPKKWKKVNKGNWKLVTKWIGKEKAQQWFEELK